MLQIPAWWYFDIAVICSHRFRSQICYNTPMFCIAAVFVKYCSKIVSVCYGVWVNSHLFRLLTANEKNHCETGLLSCWEKVMWPSWHEGAKLGLFQIRSHTCRELFRLHDWDLSCPLDAKMMGIFRNQWVSHCPPTLSNLIGWYIVVLWVYLL